MANLNGKVVVLTGASSGIGHATALSFARAGCSLALAARRERALRRVVEECEALGAQALAVPCDVAHEDAVDELARRAKRRFGRIDVWVNDASVTSFGKFAETPRDVFRQVVETNFFGTVNGSRAALAVFQEQGSGTLINVSSTYGRVATPYWSAYAASKFAVRGFSESLRMEVADEGIHVCTVFPSAVDTPLWKNGANFTGRKIKASPPTFDPEEVAAKIVACAESPRDEVTVGFPGLMVKTLHDFSPGLWKRLGSNYAQKQFEDEEAEPTVGNVFEPLDEDTSIRGGFAHQNPPAKPLRPFAALLMLATSLAGLAFGLMRASSSKRAPARRERERVAA